MAKHAPLQRAVPQTAVIVAICAVLVGITWLVFAQTTRHQFVTYDDPQYVYANPDVSAGVSLGRISWAFTHTIAGNWHPLTTISHMLDCQLYGLKPAGHHFTNVLFHTIAVVLLFLLLQQMTGSLWRSTFVAALFAIHPLHVESVAWISERKDVLSAVFFLLMLDAYVRYARAPSIRRYLPVPVLFGAGLMSKPMLVSAPFILLLLDYWPLRRLEKPSSTKGTGKVLKSRKRRVLQRLFLEKIPLLVLSVGSCVITFVLQKRAAGAIAPLPFLWRVQNALVSYVIYVWKRLWPTRLAVFYPHPNNTLAIWEVILAIGLLVAITAAAT